MNNTLISPNPIGGSDLDFLQGYVTSLLASALFLYILYVIATWKIFTKAGQAGWKSLIPIYNQYIFCKIIHINFFAWYLIPIIALSVLYAALGPKSNGYLICNFVYNLAVTIYSNIRLGRAFSKSTGFKIGLIFLPHIFMLILAFGGSKYAYETKS